MTKVRVTWDFEVDDTWEETPEECLEIAKEEFKTLTPDDVKFEIVEGNDQGGGSHPLIFDRPPPRQTAQ